jgi:predicted O-methyltransferase YrrM
MSHDKEDLQQIHRRINTLASAYIPPLELMSKVNSEYREYMWGRNGSGYYAWLALAVRVLKPKRILELGTYRGASTIMMYSELPLDCEWLISVDLEDNRDFIQEVIFADSRVRFVSGNDLDLNIYDGKLPELCDLLFIDTLHERQHVEDEWAIYKHLCSSGALVVLDDIRLNDMWEFWQALPYPKLDITADCHHSGFGIFRYVPSTTGHQDGRVVCAYRTALEVAYRRMNDASGRALHQVSSSFKSQSEKRTFEILRSVVRKTKALISDKPTCV